MSTPTRTKLSQAEIDSDEQADEVAVDEALADSEAGKPTVAHEDVSAWLKSLGTDQELPLPDPSDDDQR